MVIDAHQHFWRLADRAGGWPPATLEAIHRDFAPGDLEPEMRAAGVGGTVLVQSLPTLADTDYLLDIAARTDFVLGVVGWVDMKTPAAAGDIARFAARPKFRGIRPMLQDLADDDWIEDPLLDEAVAALIRHDLTFDALVLPRHLRPLLAFARRHPALPVVIDHGAKPWIASGHIAGWRADLEALAALPNVHCKLSGLLTEAGPRAGAAALRPYAETLLSLFGPGRLIFGSDWPVLRLAGDYAGWLAMARDFVPPAHHDAVFSENARTFYRLG